MQQFLSTLPLGGEPAAQIAVFIGGVAALALLLFALYRVLFAHRLRLPGGGRARQPRLGLVDAFSLDGQRQLVLVRRDNIEHLVMIGGPNDVVIESQIIRAAAPALAPAREHEPVATAPAASAPRPQAVVAAPTARPTPRPEVTSAKPMVAAVTPAAPPVVPARSEPPKPLGAQPARIVASPPPPLASARPTPPRPAPLPAPISASAPPLRQPPPAGQGAASLGPPAQPASGSFPPNASVAAALPPALTAREAPPKLAAAKDNAIPEEEFAGLDSLEAEMSRLLGRES